LVCSTANVFCRLARSAVRGDTDSCMLGFVPFDFLRGGAKEMG
jgi:hypothetical protein